MATPVTPRRAPIGYAQTGRGGRDDRRRGASAVDPAAPAWERPRTFQEYPTLRTRSGWTPSGRIPRLAIYGGAVVLGVIVMFSLPFLLRGGGTPAASPTPSVVASPSPSPVASPSPTPFVYTVVANDTLSKIATKFKVTVDQIMKANPTIKDPNKIAIGDQIVIPTGGSSGAGGTITQAPSPSPSP